MAPDGAGRARCVIEYDPATGATSHKFEGVPFPANFLVNHLNILMTMQALAQMQSGGAPRGRVMLPTGEPAPLR